MKIIKNILLLLVVFVLQVSIIPIFEFRDTLPNLILIIVIIIGMNFNKYTAALNGAILGLLVDIYFSSALGLNVLVYMSIGLISGTVSEYLITDNLLSLILYIIVGTIIYNIFSSFIISIFINALSLHFIIGKIFSLEVVINALLGVALFFLRLRNPIYNSIYEIEGFDDIDEE